MDWIDWSWIASTPTAVAMVALTGLVVYATLLLFTRLAGLRSFAKMSSFDFAMTVAMGSLIASTILMKDPPLVQAISGLAVLFGLQTLVSWLRKQTSFMPKLVDNRPLLLMAGSNVIQENLATARVTESDLHSKLREAGVTHLGDVLAVVMETTGDVSVIKAGDGSREVDLSLFEDVRDAHLLRKVQ